MILTCPSCGTQYVVKDGAIPVGGRQVRCASCRHSWHQDPIEEAEAEAAAGTPDAPSSDLAGAEPPPAPVSGDAEPGLGPEVLPRDEPERLAEEPLPAPIEPDEQPQAEGPDDWNEPAGEARADDASDIHPSPAIADDSVDDDFSPFAQRDPVERSGRSPLLSALVGALLIAALAAAFWFLAPPQWKQRMGLAAIAETPLQLMMTHSDRQRLASGNELLAISGRVINPTDSAQDVPAITAQLRDSAGKLVYSWTIAPPAPVLKPGASASFNSAEVNVPPGGDELTVTLGAPKAG